MKKAQNIMILTKCNSYVDSDCLVIEEVDLECRKVNEWLWNCIRGDIAKLVAVKLINI